MVQADPSRRNERGQALVEYAMIVALVGACLVAILGLVGRTTGRAYDRTAAAVSRGGSAGYGGSGGVILVSSPSRGGRLRHGTEPPPADSTGAGESADTDAEGATASR